MYSWIIITILIATVLFTFIRLRSLKTQIKAMTAQLIAYNNNETNKKLSMSLIDSELEALAEETNNVIDTLKTIKANKQRTENELKTAISTMSHDLRTPLTSIIGYLQLAQADEIEQKERQAHLSVALKRAKTLESLLHSFFELSVIESADYQLNQERINVRNVMIETLFGFYDRIDHKQIEPTVQMPDHDVWICADRLAITRILENLISNAMTYAEDNITIELIDEDEKMLFIIKNDAPNLKEQEVELLFDRFYMADQARSTHHAGLGLSIVKSLMEKMNGEVKAYKEKETLVISCEWRRN
ncbi:sensor histidine kinase KdpD [Bacillus sp. JCM 19034]|uniref:sensor histidine kinase n=1 Tax=Bacillus sp. JCM 19034 TaxID=1481928 RepID=UPI0007853815|nr:HAMP domain-containing sensor histidine kinase [Bacillus sp. JCM 19034]